MTEAENRSDFQEARNPPSTLVSRNVTIDGHRTSIRLESEMWAALFDICAREQRTVHEICTMVAKRKRPGTSLTAAIRVFIMAYYRAAATEEGHRRAGHGNGQPVPQLPRTRTVRRTGSD